MFRSIFIFSKIKYKKLANINKNLSIKDNEYGEIDFINKKQRIKEIKKNLFTYKFGNILIILSIIEILILFLLYLLDKIGMDVNKESFFVLLIMFIFPFLAILLSIKIKNSGIISYIKNIINTKITLEKNKLIYSYCSLDPDYTETYIKANYNEKIINYKDIKKIEYDKKKYKYTIYGDFKYREYINYIETNKECKKNYIDIDKLNDEFVIFDFYENKEIFKLIEEKSSIKIIDKSSKTTEKILRLGLLIISIIILFLTTPISIIYVNSQKIPIQEENQTIIYDENDKEKIINIIKEDIGENIEYKFLEKEIITQKLKNNESILRLMVLAYNKDSNNVKCYIFYKYILTNGNHKIGELELNTSYISPIITKEEVNKKE